MSRSRSVALLQVLLIVVLAASTSGCALAAGIFRAGFWVGLIVALVIVVGVWTVFRRMR
jgi:hypothetical protein